MAVEKSLVSGSMTMLLLGLLKEKDMYGYEMIDTLRRKSRNVFELKAGTLYPLLHGMEEKGYLPLTNRNMRERSENITALRKRENRSLPKRQKNGRNMLPP